jgi:RimJ/RimL family protein N-acetyltransferase
VTSIDPNQVQLAPVSAADLDAFEVGFDSLATNGQYQWFGHSPAIRLRAMWQERGLLNGEHNMLSVHAHDELVGRVEWFSRAWGRPATSSCWEIAIGLFPRCQGQGIGTTAQRLLVRYLFDHTRVDRIQMTTDPENQAQVKAAAKVGFTLEGTVRSAQWRLGKWHDQLLYSVLRDEADVLP